MASKADSESIVMVDSPTTLQVDTTVTNVKSQSTFTMTASTTSTTSTPVTPGSFSKSNGTLPNWYKVGWTAFSELPNPGHEQDLETLKGLLGGSTDAVINAFSTSRPDKNTSNNDLVSRYLGEAYYGEWYHNAGAMLVAVASTWIQTKLGGGLMGCLVIGVFLGKLSFLLDKQGYINNEGWGNWHTSLIL